MPSFCLSFLSFVSSGREGGRRKEGCLVYSLVAIGRTAILELFDTIPLDVGLGV